MDTMINFGSSIKSKDDGTISGKLVIFSTENDPDLSGDYFTKDTDFGFEGSIKSPVWLHHRKPLKTQDGKYVTRREKIGEATLTKTEDSILVEAILFNHKQYKEALDSLGWSSGTAAHLVERERKGAANFVKQWLLGLDASVTPIPCEPRTSPSIKSLDDDIEYQSDFIIENNELKAVAKVSTKATGGDVFEQNLSEQNQNFWRLESALMESAKDIANAAAAVDITGEPVDVFTLVTDAYGRFSQHGIPMTVKQITEWLKEPNRENFYLKSTFLDAIISSESPVKQSYEDQLDTVLAAVERVAQRTTEIHEMRKARKSGAKISKARLDKLRETIANLTAIVAEADKDSMATETEKSVDQSVILNLVAEFEHIKAMPNLAGK